MQQHKVHKEEREQKPLSISLPSSESSHVYAVLKIDWPVAERVMVKLGALITSCTGGRPIGNGIMHDIVERAIKAYSRALYGQRNGKCHDRVRIGVFIDCLLQETFRFIHEGQIPVIGEVAAVMSNPASEQELRRSLYELLVCDSLKRVLKEACFEETILDGRALVRD